MSNTTFKVPKNRFGTLKKAKSGSLYIEVDQDMNFAKGEKLFLKTPAADIDGLVERGFIQADVAEERKAKVPEFIKYYIDKSSSSKI